MSSCINYVFRYIIAYDVFMVMFVRLGFNGTGVMHEEAHAYHAPSQRLQFYYILNNSPLTSITCLKDDFPSNKFYGFQTPISFPIFQFLC